MDHRWDDMLHEEHIRRVEQERYEKERIGRDPQVERRDQLAAPRERVNKSPWEIGASHWDQRDLYTRNSDIDERGYARGPSVHPEEGSYAYHRDVAPPHPADAKPVPAGRPHDSPSIYERQAWPWLNYDRWQPDHGWWRRSDDSIREDVCEALAYEPRLDARDIEVEVKDGEVTLKGTVATRDEKRLAEHVLETIRGVSDIHNRLTIKKDDDDGIAFTAPIPAF